MPQECPVAFVYLTWFVYLAGLLWLAVRGSYLLAAAWAVSFPAALRGYVALFPRLSPWLGYGSVDDEPADELPAAPGTVTLYTSSSCPFCPIVRDRLLDLQSSMGFELEEVDVTLKPELIRRKGIRAVPVVEAGGRLRAGNATTRELVDLLAAGAAGPGPDVSAAPRTARP